MAGLFFILKRMVVVSLVLVENQNMGALTNIYFFAVLVISFRIFQSSGSKTARFEDLG